MSLLVIPRPTQPSEFNRLPGVDLDDALDSIAGQRARIDRLQGAANVRFRNDTPEAALTFSLPPVQGDPAALANGEGRIADLLCVSRVPGASGSRSVFVDLSRGVLLVGTAVFFNDRNVAVGVVDESLVHKIDMIAALLSLNDFSQAPAAADEPPLRIHVDNIPEDRLERAEVVINGQAYALSDILEDVEPVELRD